MEIVIKDKILLAMQDIIRDTPYDGRVYVVGGYVRDLVMGRENDDIDLLIDGGIDAGIEFAKWFCEKTGSHPPVEYGLYGTAMFQFMDSKIESVAPRSEKYVDGSRNPIVSESTIIDDCFRRDFTINSLFLNLSTNEIIDYSEQGINDIKNHIIRSTSDPKIIFREDPLRILRAIRFSSRFSFNIASHTLDGMKEFADRLVFISQERITDELNKILLCGRPSQAIDIITYIDAWRWILPEFKSCIGCQQNKYHCGDVALHTKMVVDNTPPVLELRLAALFHDIAKPKVVSVDDKGQRHFYNHEEVSARWTEDIMRRMKYSNDMIEIVSFLVKYHMRTKQFGNDCSKMSDKSLRKIMHVCKTKERFELLMQLIDADNHAHAPEHCLPMQVSHICERAMELVDKGMDMFNFKLPINGNDIIEVKKISAGPLVKKYLEVCYKLAYNNPKMTKEDYIKNIKNLKLC